MWGALGLGVVAGGFGPALAKNIFGLKPDAPEVPALPEPIEGVLRYDRGLSYGDAHARQRFDLLRPPVHVDGPYPVIVLFHGGSFARGSRRDVAGIGRALARQGYAVLTPDYRLLPRSTLPSIIADACAVTRYAYDSAATLQLDTDRLVTMGRSAGGHLALMAAYTSGLPIRGVVSESGPTDFDPVMWDGSVRGAVMQRLSRGFDAHDLSPAHVATAGSPPTLLLHGCRDGNVPFAHARIMQVRLQGLGVPVELVAVPRTGHLPLQWRWRSIFPVVCHWLQEALAR